MAKSLFEKLVDKSITTLNEDDLKGVKNIGKYGLARNVLLTSVKIPNSVTNIGMSAFYGCTSLPNIEIPRNVTTIEESAFNQCTELKTVILQSGVSKIGKTAFANTNGYMSIVDAYFYQPAGMTITLPTAGSSTGMFYVKTARSMNIYTENETIKNYDWSADNITPIFHHWDGTAW